MGCLISIILIGILLPLAGIVFLNFFGLAFAWGDLWFYIIVASVAYILLWIISSYLSNKFKRNIESFIRGDKLELLTDRKALGSYGFLQFVMLPFLIYVMLICLYFAVFIGIISLNILAEAERVPVVLVFAIGVLVFGSGYAILKGFYKLLFTKQIEPEAIEIKKSGNEKLWKLIAEVAERVETRPVKRILLTPYSGIGVFQSGNIFSSMFGGGQRTLMIGIPSVVNLNISEFSAILAHEYGHFSNRDTRWGAFSYMLNNSVQNTILAIPKPSEGASGVYNLILWLNPVLWIMTLYLRLYLSSSGSFSRVREIIADELAMKFYGGNNFSSGLQQVVLNDKFYEDVVLKEYVSDFLKDGKVISNFYDLMQGIYSGVPPKKLKELKLSAAKEDMDENIFDSHPRVGRRVEYAERFPKEKTDKEHLPKLFDDWKKLNSEVADIYYKQLFKLLEQNQKNVSESQSQSD